jgi:signal transduction histidine kinase
MTRLSPWRLTAYAAAQMVLSLLALVVAILEAVALVLSVIVVGIPLLLVLTPVSRWLIGLHRRMAGSVLQVEVPATYLPTAGLGPVQRFATVARDPMTWRDLAWLVVAFPLAFTASFAVVLLLLCVVTGVAWWFAAGPIMYLRSRADQWLLTIGLTERLEQRVEALTETRNQTLDHAAAELRRIERDLHDGAQARLASLGMTLGMAAELVERDPEGAQQLLAEARQTSSAALGDLRDVVHGIHPPVLADRGLTAAVEALALDLPIAVDVSGEAPPGLPAPVESAAYFAVAECLANIAKHAGARQAWVELAHSPALLTVVVGDDGHGGADPASGTGMRGVARRLAAFDGTMRVSSPKGGPTLVTLEVPCDSSSPRTTPSSETA